MQDFKRESRVEYVPFHEMKSNLLREFSNVLSPLIYECLKRMFRIVTCKGFEHRPFPLV